MSLPETLSIFLFFAKGIAFFLICNFFTSEQGLISMMTELDNGYLEFPYLLCFIFLMQPSSSDLLRLIGKDPNLE